MNLARLKEAGMKKQIPENTLRWQLSQGVLTRHKYGRATYVDLDEIDAKIRRDTAKANKKGK